MQLYCTKENTFPLSIKSAVCGKIYQGPAGLSDKVRAFGFHSSWKVALVCVSLLLVCVLFVCLFWFFFPHLLPSLRLLKDRITPNGGEGGF